jgi:coproporphyrinogen III oxidase
MNPYVEKTWSTEQMVLEIVQVRIATGVTRVIWTAVVLWCGKQMEKLPHYHSSWIVSFQKQRYHVCEMLGDRRGYSHLKEEALDHIKWRNRFSRGFGPVIWQITDDDDVEKCSTFLKACLKMFLLKTLGYSF